MSEKFITDFATQYETLATEKQLIVLHPSSYAQHYIFEQFLLQNLNAIYVQLPPDGTLADGMAHIASAMHTQTTQTIVFDDEAKQAAQQLADALQTSNCSLLYLDGFDGNIALALTPVIALASPLLKNGKHIVLAGRRFPSDIYEYPEAIKYVGILQLDHGHLAMDYLPAPDRVLMEVRAFGDGSVWVNGRLIEQWEGLLPRTLFFYFIDRAMITRNDIFNTFWPDLSAKEATNVFHVTKSKINEILDVPLMTHSSGYYRISPEIELRYDAVLFQEAIQYADIAEDEEAANLYRSAINFYRHEFLTSIRTDWATRRRDEMRSMCVNALLGLAQLQHNKNQQEALGLLVRANAMQPNREDVARQLMLLHADMQNPQDALAVFHKFQQRFGQDNLESETLTVLNKIHNLR